MEIDRLQGHGYGVTSSSKGKGDWLAATGGLLGEWRLGRVLSLVATVAAVTPITRPDFVLDGVGSVYRPPSVGLRAELGFLAAVF